MKKDPNATRFQWNKKKEAAAIALARGLTIDEAAAEAGCGEKSIDRWKRVIEFTAEVDRLSLMVGIASRAERLRIAMRVVRKKTKETEPVTEKDLLDWLKYAQSETDGVKLDLTALLAALGADEAPVAGGGPGGTGDDADEEAS